MCRELESEVNAWCRLLFIIAANERMSNIKQKKKSILKES